MSNKLSKPDASARLLGRRHQVAIWSVLRSHNIESLPTFYVAAIHRQVIREGVGEPSPNDVTSEINDFEATGMIERINTPSELPPVTKAYQCVPASPGWLMVNGVVEAFTAWYPPSAE